VPSTNTVYVAGSLIVEELTDENNQKKIIYKNEQGQLILSKVQAIASPDSGHYGWMCTYYIYDEMNNLRVVLPPKAVDALIAVSWNLSGNSAIMTGLCYAYYYDNKVQMIMKFIPGKDKSYIAYDLLGRVVMTQDANLRLTDQWAFVKYDGQSRPIKSGLLTSSLNKDSIIEQASRSADYPSLSGTYTVTSESYYDDYSWTSGTPVSSSLVTTHINSANFYNTYNASPEYAQSITVSNRIRGAVTGSKRIIIGTSTYLYSLSLYDESGRVIQVKGTNITGGTDVVTSQYSFSGRILRTHLAHEKSGTNAQNHTVLTKYLYDHVGRLDSLIKNIDSTGDKILVKNNYNELGQLISKKLSPSFNSNAGLETLNYEYNIRGWLIGMNRDFVKDSSASNWFGYEVAYDDTSNIINGQSYSSAQYNGNISGITWKSKGDEEKRKYDFNYDYTNRLISADFNQYTESSFNKNAGIDFSLNSISYDINGNILSMTQKGWKLGGSITIDSLLYGYISNSNKLDYVNDLANDTTTRLGDFKEFTNNTSQDYGYDDNGNLVSDANKKITAIIYNYLNLPDSIHINGKGTIKYVYDAGGNKIKKITTDSTGGTVKISTDLYLAGYYVNDSLQFIGTEEGRARIKDTSVVYDYFIKDHLGNIRMVLTEEQQTDMYPAATMEESEAKIEESYYSNVAETRIEVPKEYPANTPDGNTKVAIVRGNDGTTETHIEIGPGMLLKVMAGDKFNLTVNSWWSSGVEPTPPAFSLGLGQILNAIGGNTILQNEHFNPGEVQNSTELNNSVASFLNSQTGNYDANLPKAFVNWILFDERFNYISSNSGFEQVGSDETYSTHTRTDMPLDKNGYLFVYVSNETPNVDVYFDNLQVTHIQGPLLEENHYYPFGLTMNGISSKVLGFGGSENKVKYNGKALVFAKPENKFKYNDGSELDETFGINLYSTFFRHYDQQIGRFTGIDILAEVFSSITPYQFGYNNPVLYNDPLGALNTTSTGSQYRSQKGPDGNYHTGWVTEMLWNDLGFFDWGNYGGGGNGSGSYYNIMGLSSTQVLSQMKFGDSFGMNKKTGEYGFWCKYAYSIDNGSGNTSGEVVVGTRFISLPFSLSYHLENGLSTLTNNSKYTIWFKPENNDLPPQSLRAGESTTMRIDGVTHPNHSGKVFKVVNNFDVVFGVFADSDGISVGKSILDVISQELNELLGGGWLSAPPDSGWDAIFEKAGYKKKNKPL
jgi:RHS repeat-associated protein